MHTRLPLAVRRNPACLAIAFLVFTAIGPRASRPSLQTVRLIVGDDVTSVILSADGALPSPTVGVLANPPRIYLDFRDVATATKGLRVDGDYLVRAVRVAVNQPEPLVTRVVIDLKKPAPHRIEAGMRSSGTLTVVVGVPVAPAGPPAPQVPGRDVAADAAATRRTPPAEPPEAAARARAPATAPPALPPPTPPDATATRAARSPGFAWASGTTSARAPAEDAAAYLTLASPLLDRLERLRPVLVSLDALTALPDQRLRTAAEEFESIRRALGTIVPPGTVTATHELFRDVCVLGAASATARVAPASDDSTRAWNAAAAAAGAVMFLERARAELGLPPGRM